MKNYAKWAVGFNFVLGGLNVLAIIDGYNPGPGYAGAVVSILTAGVIGAILWAKEA